MNTIDILIEGYAKITDSGWEASGTTCLITVDVILSDREGSHSINNSGEVSIERDSSPQEDLLQSSGAVAPQNDKKQIRIITDPGANRDLLFERLKEKIVSLEDIDYVFLTHHHLDHAMNVGLFPNAKVVDEEAIYTQAKAVESVKMIPETDITILPTPGHEGGHGILVVPTKDGTVVVAGDNFWWSSSEEQKVDIDKSDDFAEDMEALKLSRKQVLDLADWVVPGHGKVFKVEK